MGRRKAYIEDHVVIHTQYQSDGVNFKKNTAAFDIE